MRTWELTVETVEGLITGIVFADIDLKKLLDVAAQLPGLIGHDVPSQLLKAGARNRLHPAPDYVKDLG